MIELILTVIPSICWLLYRCYILFQTPVSEIVEDLHIEIPHIPNICIDSITEDSVVIHWDIEVRPDESLIYVVLVNNREATTISSSSCKFSDLQNNKLYQIQVIAVNSLTNFRSQSCPVFIETLPSAEEDVERLLNCESTPDPVFSDADLSPDLDEKQVKQLQDPKLLNEYLNFYQSQLSKINREFKVFNESHIHEFVRLKDELNNLKKILVDKTNAHNKKGTISKDYQKKKEQLLHQKTKLSAQLENAKNSVSIHESNLLELYTELEKLTDKKAVIEKNSIKEERFVDDRINQLKSDIVTAKAANKSSEEEVRTVKIAKKKIFKLLEAIQEIADAFNDTCFNKDYTLTPKGFEMMTNLFAIKPDWENELTLELNRLADFEHEWRKNFKREIRNYVTIQNNLENIRLNLNTDYVPDYVSEYVASVHFGGYSNALKGRKKPMVTTAHSSSSSSPLPTSATAATDTFQHYGDVYNGGDSPNSMTGQFKIDSPVQDHLFVNNPIMVERPTSPLGQGQSYLAPMANSTSMLWNNSNTPMSSDKELVSPPMIGMFNQSNSSLNRYSPTLWNDNPTHTRNISGSSLHMRRGLESEFRPFDSNMNGSATQLTTSYGSPLSSQLGAQNNQYLSSVPLGNVNSLGAGSFVGINNQPNFLSPFAGSEVNLGRLTPEPPSVHVVAPGSVDNSSVAPSVSAPTSSGNVRKDEKYLGY